MMMSTHDKTVLARLTNESQTVPMVTLKTWCQAFLGTFSTEQDAECFAKLWCMDRNIEYHKRDFLFLHTEI